MNKICTSLEQSKKLIELGIDINTADMYYEEVCNLPKAIIGNYILHNQCMEDKDYKKLSNPVLSPAWSLSALLDILPCNLKLVLAINDFQGDRKEKYVIGSVEHDKYDCFADDPVDACYEMILKLHELKKL